MLRIELPADLPYKIIIVSVEFVLALITLTFGGTKYGQMFIFLYAGALITTLLILFVFMGSIAGYSSARVYKLFGGKEWKKNTFLTATFYPGTTPPPLSQPKSMSIVCC